MTTGACRATSPMPQNYELLPVIKLVVRQATRSSLAKGIEATTRRFGPFQWVGCWFSSITDSYKIGRIVTKISSVYRRLDIGGLVRVVPLHPHDAMSTKKLAYLCAVIKRQGRWEHTRQRFVDRQAITVSDGQDLRKLPRGHGQIDVLLELPTSS
jgi:hypothetical protein